VIDAVNKKFIKAISLSEQYYGKFLEYSAHNVQVSPKGSIIAVTANILEKEGAHGGEMTNSDEVILIDPMTESVIGRIPMGIGMHLAHVVINSTDTRAYVASQEK
jgi:DNA-binding beta-propeller fold protein YncE